MKKKALIGVLMALFLASTVSAQEWHNTNQEITLDASDNESGVENTYYCIDQDDTCQPRDDGQAYEGSITVSTEGINYVRYNSRDNVGNIEETHSRTVKIDKTRPETSDNYPGGWVNTSVTVDLSCSDPDDPSSGCEEETPTEYCVGDVGGSCSPDTEGDSVTFDTEGQRELRYRSSDVAGNTEVTKSTVVRLDFTDPQISVQKESISSDTMNATVACTDDRSGCDESSLSLYTAETSAFNCPADPSRYNQGSTYEVNQHLWVCAIGKDQAGNLDNSNQPVEFSVGTLTTDLYYPGHPGTVVTSIDSSIPVMLDIGNEEADKTRRVNVTIDGPNAEFAGGGTSQEVVLEGVQNERMNFVARPEEQGNSTVEISIREETEGFTVNEEIEIQTRGSGSRTSSAGRSVPGIGLFQAAALVLMASSYYWISR